MNLYYGDFHALKDVNLEIEANKITAFIGPSGCGKSTLLKSINRMNDLVEGCRIEGSLLLDGEDIYKDVDVNLLRKRVGMVFQKPNPFPMSIYDKDVYKRQDQYDDGVNGDSNIILTSALKKMDVVVYNELNLIKEGKFEGKNEILSSSTDSVGIVTEEGRQQLSQGTIDKLNESYDLMKEGTVVPASGDNGYTPDDFPGLK